MRKYMFLLLLAALMLLCLFGCGRKDIAQIEDDAAAAVDTMTDAPQGDHLVDPSDGVTLLEFCDGAITLRFSPKDDGQGWRWVDEPTFPLDGTQVETILEALQALEPLTTLDATELDLYGLQTPQKYVIIAGEDWQETMHIGDQAEDGTWYMVMEGENLIHTIPDEFVQMLSYNVYDMALLPTLPAFSSENVHRIIVEGSEKTAFLQQADGHWKATNETVAGRADAVITALQSLQVSRCFDFLPSAQALQMCGFASPTATITVEYRNTVGVDTSFTIHLGALRSLEDGYYATLGEDSTIYLIPSAHLSALLLLPIYVN